MPPPPFSGKGPVERATFGLSIALDYTPISITVRPGDIVGVPLTWRALVLPGMRYAVFVHVCDADGSPSPRTTVTQPVAISRQTVAAWRWHRRPPRPVDRGGYAAGHYPPIVGLYERDIGKRISVQDAAGRLLGDSLFVGTVEVVPR